MRCVEEWRGDEVRARLVRRQFNQAKRDDIFSGTPDAWFMRFQNNRCRQSDWGNPSPRGIGVVDISVAFMHADAAEEIIVKVPPGIKSGPKNTGYWRLLKALNGTRKASQSFQDFCATILIKWGFVRNIILQFIIIGIGSKLGNPRR